MESQVFITMSAVSINDNEGCISLSRAGHMPFLLKRNGKVQELIPKGIGIGLTNSRIFDSNIEQNDLCLQKGDGLLLFTDGLNEMRNLDNEEFGFNELIKVIENSNPKDAKEFVDNIRNTISDFAGEDKHHDDLTLIALIYH
jgi:serine phosphatase RsbU (regulator of sigma subunit)